MQNICKPITKDIIPLKPYLSENTPILPNQNICKEYTKKKTNKTSK